MQTEKTKTGGSESDRAPHESMVKGADAAGEAVRHAQASLSEAGVAAKEFANQGLDVVRESADKVEDAAARISDRASSYVQAQPLKSLLIATAAGALVAIVAGMASRR